MFQSRTHTCNELRLENAGEQVRIVGWMENVREVGQNFAFVVVRDFYGTTQVVIETEDMMKVVKSLNKESTIAVEGTVRERASKNPKPLVPTMPVKNDGETKEEFEQRKRKDYYDLSSISGVFKSFGDAPGGFKEEMQEIRWSLGAEYVYNDKFSVRAGYHHESENKGNRK